LRGVARALVVSVYPLLEAHDLITSPAYVMIKAANESPAGPVPSIDRARRLLALHRSRLGPTMCTSDVTATLDQAFAALGPDHINVKQRPRLLSDNGPSYVAEDLAMWLKGKDM
jgi:putative transposase